MLTPGAAIRSADGSWTGTVLQIRGTVIVCLADGHVEDDYLSGIRTFGSSCLVPMGGTIVAYSALDLKLLRRPCAATVH